MNYVYKNLKFSTPVLFGSINNYFLNSNNGSDRTVVKISGHTNVCNIWTGLRSLLVTENMKRQQYLKCCLFQRKEIPYKFLFNIISNAFIRQRLYKA